MSALVDAEAEVMSPKLLAIFSIKAEISRCSRGTAAIGGGVRSRFNGFLEVATLFQGAFDPVQHPFCMRILLREIFEIEERG